MMTDFRSCQIRYGRRGRKRKYNKNMTIPLKCDWRGHIQTLKRFTKLVNEGSVQYAVLHVNAILEFEQIALNIPELIPTLWCHAAWHKQKQISTLCFTLCKRSKNQPPVFTWLHSETFTALPSAICQVTNPFNKLHLARSFFLRELHRLKGERCMAD